MQAGQHGNEDQAEDEAVYSPEGGLMEAEGTPCQSLVIREHILGCVKLMMRKALDDTFGIRRE